MKLCYVQVIKDILKESTLKVGSKIKEFLRDNWGSLITILFPIIVSINYVERILNDNYLYWILAVTLITIGFVQTVYTSSSKKTLMQKIVKLEDDNSFINETINALPLDMIKILSKHFKLGNDERVTLYEIRDDETLIPVARFSESPIYRKYGRSAYTNDSGYIGECWAKGFVKVEKLADYSRNPDRYVQQAMKNGGSLSEIEIHGLQMKSRSLYGKRLHYNGDKPIAIVIIESMATDLPVSVDDLNKFLSGPFGKVLIESLQKNMLSKGRGGVNG